jgi:uncharacterized protein (TIGR03083 family)
MKSEMSANVAAWEQSVRSTIALAETFTDDDWKRPTECPGWTVQDVLAHLVSVELTLLGEDPAPGHVLNEYPDYVRNDLGRFVEPGVDARRSKTGPEVLAELREVLDRRLVALPGIDPDQPYPAPTGGTVPYAVFMAIRAFDCWTHEQDVRRAVGRHGNVDAPAAERTRRLMEPGLPIVVAKRAGAAPGETVLFEVIGPPTFTTCVEVADNGRGHLTQTHPENPTATLRMDWETFARLTAGRCTPTDVKVDTHGDAALATRVLESMGLTP